MEKSKEVQTDGQETGGDAVSKRKTLNWQKKLFYVECVADYNQTIAPAVIKNNTRKRA